jgi:hypothetical protein
MIFLEKKLLSSNAITFYNDWFSNIESINNNMKAIKKLQNECTLLNLCCENDKILNNNYFGWIITFENDNKYTVFIPELKMTSTVKLEKSYNIYDKLEFKLYLFTDEDNLKKKIKLENI